MNAATREQFAPVVLIIGATGQTGRLVVEKLERDPGGVRIRLALRDAARAEALRAEGRDAVHLDLDDPRTFPTALAGVDRVFLLTGYTVAMVHQSKTLVDAAKKAGVEHIVHQGAFAEWDTTDPHFAWHQMVERYIEASGMAWTHLHPNVFMEAFVSTLPLKDGVFPWYMGEARVGWAALKDVAALAAAVLREGPTRHGGKDYWVSSEATTAAEAAAILSEALGREVRPDHKAPEAILEDIQSSGAQAEAWYAAGAVEWARQIVDGRMGYIGTVRDDAPYVTGRPATTLRAWAAANRERLLGR